ncbi:3-deoxy-7-phosphoheptulonate synthase [Nocardiopsis mwathae]|uniref:Phospho-2-dehydro-3-deoxyheptonate aldolase n=1 Tax=Nocardiopsis mwathae TaxID=1472723 RepID=A0A7W9YLU9_9ACTN|nr:3-deoxy-7-phosphoheptulonate synthase class II [Nocardiopsis mwathae]MBB6174548.1 3-deoxy-7-phosphoheptulonate synthase [Nocardiopsis mwathae]
MPMIPTDTRALVAAPAADRLPETPAAWHRASWRHRPAHQQPLWPDPDRACEAARSVSMLPPPVAPASILRLRRDLARAADGSAVVFQGGDCAERFASCVSDTVAAKLRTLLQSAMMLSLGSGLPVVKIGRIAGQFGKPRSADTEVVDGVELPVYRGDIVNGPEPTPEARRPDPERMLHAYGHTRAALRTLGGCEAGGADPGEFAWVLEQGPLYTSHEALLLDYEEALTRLDPATDRWFDTSAHMVWVGERTRALDGAHIEFVSGIANPVGVKLGPGADIEEVVELCARLDPARSPGRLVLVPRMGARHVRDALPPLVRAVRSAGHPVVWVCDPMHGNTVRSHSGYKTRRFTDIATEVEGFFAVHRAEGTHPAGVHLEMTGEDVTECLGGVRELCDERLAERYETACDPRLNGAQTVELVFAIAEELRSGLRG